MPRPRTTATIGITAGASAIIIGAHLPPNTSPKFESREIKTGSPAAPRFYFMKAITNCETWSLYEESLAQLIAPNEGFRRAVATEQILNLAILINLLGRANDRS